MKFDSSNYCYRCVTTASPICSILLEEGLRKTSGRRKGERAEGLCRKRMMSDAVSVGKRLKLLRQASLLSLQELSDMLVGSRLPIKRAALSHYESGITLPNERAIEELARTLGSTPHFFERPDWEDIRLTFCREPGLSGKYEIGLLSFLQIELEKIYYIDRLLGCDNPFVMPEKVRVSRGQEDRVEKLAAQVRKAYGAQFAPVSSVTALLEYAGWNIIELPNAFDIAAISGFERSRSMPYILHTSLYAVDDYRASLLEALGEAYLQGEDEAHSRELALRFSRAMLFPDSCVYAQFGKKRENVSITELTFMKQVYGLSKRSIMMRLKELDVVSEHTYNEFEDLMRLHGFPRRKKVMAENIMFYENPTKAAMRVMDALDRNLISQKEADNLLLVKHMI